MATLSIESGHDSGSSQPISTGIRVLEYLFPRSECLQGPPLQSLIAGTSHPHRRPIKVFGALIIAEI
jgi:hypothetical protein